MDAYKSSQPPKSFDITWFNELSEQNYSLDNSKHFVEGDYDLISVLSACSEFFRNSLEKLSLLHSNSYAISQLISELQAFLVQKGFFEYFAKFLGTIDAYDNSSRCIDMINDFSYMDTIVCSSLLRMTTIKFLLHQLFSDNENDALRSLKCLIRFAKDSSLCRQEILSNNVVQDVVLHLNSKSEKNQIKYCLKLLYLLSYGDLSQDNKEWYLRAILILYGNIQKVNSHYLLRIIYSVGTYPKDGFFSSYFYQVLFSFFDLPNIDELSYAYLFSFFSYRARFPIENALIFENNILTIIMKNIHIFSLGPICAFLETIILFDSIFCEYIDHDGILSHLVSTFDQQSYENKKQMTIFFCEFFLHSDGRSKNETRLLFIDNIEYFVCLLNVDTPRITGLLLEVYDCIIRDMSIENEYFESFLTTDVIGIVNSIVDGNNNELSAISQLFMIHYKEIIGKD